MHQLSHLLHIRKDLLSKIHALESITHGDAAAKAALLASECKELEAAIHDFSVYVLTHQPVHGHA